MVRHIREGDQDSEESEDVEDKDKSFESWEQFSANRVDTDGKQCYGPEQQCDVPSLRLVGALCEDDRRLDQGRTQKA